MTVASAGPYASLHLIPDNYANIPPLSFLQAGCPSCRPTNSVKVLKILGKLLILLLLLLLLLHSFLLLRWTELIGLLVQCSTVALYPLDDVATYVSVTDQGLNSRPLSSNNLRQAVHTHTHTYFLSPSSINQMAIP